MLDPAADADGPHRVPHFSGLDTRLIASASHTVWGPIASSPCLWAFQAPQNPFRASDLDEDAFEDEDDLDEEEDELYDDEDENEPYDDEDEDDEDEDSYFFPDDE